MDKLTLDASVRQDYGNADGSFAGTTQASNFDVNGDGIIQQTERSVSLVDVANQNPVNYDWSYTSYRSEEHTSELQSLMRISYAVFCLKKKTKPKQKHTELISTPTLAIINNTTQIENS